MGLPKCQCGGDLLAADSWLLRTGPGSSLLAELLVGKAKPELIFLTAWICNDFPSSGCVGGTNKSTILAHPKRGSMVWIFPFVSHFLVHGLALKS